MGWNEDGDARLEGLAALRVRIEAAGVDDDEKDLLTRQLRSELRDSTDADRVDLVASGPAPGGSKAGEVLQLGELAVSILPAAIPGLIGALRSWAGRHERQEMKVMVKVGDRAIDLEYPVGAMTRDDLLKLVALVTAAPSGDASTG